MAEQRSTLIIEISSEQAARNARALDRELQSIERTGNYATTSMNSMSVAARQLAGYLAGVVTVGTAIAKMDTYTGLQNRLKLVTKSQTELNTAMTDTFAIAQKTASSWDSTAMVYQRFADNAQRLGITMKTTAELTETVSKAISISGGSAASAEAALMQFGQALASGVLRGEEFNSIAEQAPGLLKAIAMGMDTNVGALRAMAAEGKITGDELVKALTKAKPYVDDLFGKTDFTIAQSFTQLSNEVTKFVGVAGQGSGAAAGLSGAISGLAENLGLIANVAVIGGVALLTKTILTQAVAIYGSVKASMARRSADLAILQSQVQLAGIEVQRTRQVAALALTEVNLARQEYNNATTRAARAAATIRLTQAEVALALAEKQKTAATVADTVAQNANNAARSRGAMIFNAAGGWVGVLTIGVAALAAGYMYLKSRTAEANAKLEEQGKIAQETDAELRKLSGNDKISAVQNLTAAFDDQNKKLAESKESVDAVLFAIRAASVENEKARKVTEDARNGVISYNQAIELLNKMDIPTDLYEMLKKQVIQYDENAEKASNSQRVLKILGVEFKLSGNAAQNSAVQFDKSTESLGKNATAADKAAKAHSEYTKTALSDIKEMAARAQMQKMGFGENQIEERLKVLKLLNFDPTLAHSQTGIEMKNLADISAKMKDSEDAKAEALKKQTDHKAKQLKITQAELEVAKRSAALIEKSGLGKYAESKGIPSSVIAGLLAQESGGIRDVKSPTGAIGYFQTTSGYRKENNLSVADSYNLEKSGKVAIDNIARVYEKTGDLAQAILSHNAGEGGASQFTKTGKVKGGAARNKEVSQYVGKVSRYADIIAGGVGKSGISEKDNDRAYQKQLKVKLDLIKQGVDLQEKYESEQAQRSKARDEEILLAQQSNQAELIPKIKERYDAQDKLAKLQQDYELNGYKYTEDQKLIYQRDSAKEQLDAEGKYSDDVKALRKKAYDDLYDYEIKKTKLVRESALFEHKRVLMLEADAIKQKYQLERREIELNAKAKGYDAEYLKAYNASYIRGGVGIDDNHTSRTKNQFLPNTPYTDKDSDLEKLKAYSGLLLQSQGIMQTAVNMAKNGRGEDSKTFKMLGGGLEAITGIQQLTSARSGQKSELGKLNEERDNALKQLQERLDAVKNAEDASHQERLDAEKVFQSAKEQLQKEYSVKSVEAVKADNQNQLAFYGQMLSQTSVVWSDMTQLIKDAKGENSKTFRAMFLAQQSMAIAQQIINTELAAGATTAQTGIFGMPAAAVIRGVGYASVGLIAAQTISEFSNGGYTGAGGKYDPAGIVHKGEVVFSQEDIARWGGVGNVEKLRKNGGYSDGGVVGNSYNQGRQYDAISQARANVALQPNITINNYSNETVETSTAPNGDLLVQIGKMMDKKIDDGVDKGIQRNLKQGYPLARAIKNKG